MTPTGTSFFLLLTVFVLTSTATTTANSSKSNTPFQRRTHHTTITTMPSRSITATTSAFQEQPSHRRLVLIRHGCTHMNEYLTTPGSSWGDPSFTDVFPTPSQRDLYHDSPLSSKGLEQADRLRDTLADVLRPLTVDLVAVGPLTRTLQTYETGVRPNLPAGTKTVALPLASERLYLVSDRGKAAEDLAPLYPSVDFDEGFEGFDRGHWWYEHDGDDEEEEWRPSEEGQIYACAGEPPRAFEERMEKLYEWLEEREEGVIVLVAHWGVLEWLTGERFDNCEVRVLGFGDLVRGKGVSEATD